MHALPLVRHAGLSGAHVPSPPRQVPLQHSDELEQGWLSDDAVLHGWSRPPMPVTSPRLESVDDDDRRWLWLAALCLMAVEIWIRRSRSAEAADDRYEEDARVA